MSYKRRSSTKIQDKEVGHLRGPNGRRLCRFCRNEVPPSKRTFCSAECIHEWRLRSNVSYLRKHLYERDLGICDICKLDTRQLKIKIEDAWRLTKRSSSSPSKSPVWAEFLKIFNLSHGEAFRSLWQADHITPVIEGGGECGLDGVRTTCITCHKQLTKELAKRRAKSKKSTS